MQCRFDNFVCESCLEVEGEECAENSICNLPPNLTLWLHFINPFNFKFSKEYTVDGDGCIEIITTDLPAGWWGFDFWKIEVQASTDEAGCNIISFTNDGNEYGCLLYTFVLMPTVTTYTATVCGVRKVEGNLIGSPLTIQNTSLIGASELMVSIDGMVVNALDNNGNTNWTFDNVTGEITFTYNLPNAPYFIMAF